MFTFRPGLAARTAAFGIFLSLSLPAQPPLTTIQDVLYKADGTRFNGFVQIGWTSFEAGDTSNIATQFRAVRIVDGNFSVKLVPTTNADPPATYAATYNSDGRVQFQETWAVPPSSKPLRIRDVRISTPSNLDSGSSGPVQESDVVGLVADLNSRPTEGPGYAGSRVIVSNPNGELEAAGGNLSDCVHVDGTSGPCGSATSVPGYVDGETPGGVVDGANAAFTLANPPSPAASLALYRNGMLQKAGLDYALSGSTVQFVTAATPQPGDTLLASYRVAAAGSQLAEDTAGPSVQTLCSSSGGLTFSTASTSLGTCVIPAGTLQPGDRVEIHFDYSHSGTGSGFAFQVEWGWTTLVSRQASPADALVTGRADAAIVGAGAQWSAESWGSTLEKASVIGMAGDLPGSSLTVSFFGNLTQSNGDSIVLNNFTVVRYLH